MGLLDRIQDSFKYLDKNGMHKFMTLIKQYMDGDRHWTGTHAEYEVQKDSIPANTILHFTDDYEEGYGIVDAVEDNNMQAVTSNAVYSLSPKSMNVGTVLKYKLPASTWTASGSELDINFESRSDGGAPNILPKGRWLLSLTWLCISNQINMTDVSLRVDNMGVINLRGACTTEAGKPDFQVSLSTCGVAIVSSDAGAPIKLYGKDLSGSINGDVNYWRVSAIKLADY